MEASAADCSADTITAQRASPGVGTGPADSASVANDISTAKASKQDGLSVRAENILKQLAAELTGENPPKGRWIPPDKLLRKLRFSDLSTARNCGPQTRGEIVRWAESQGVVIRQPLDPGKSLSLMWRDLIARSLREEFNKAELAEALETSTRRGNTRIPLAFQSILVKLLNSGE